MLAAVTGVVQGVGFRPFVYRLAKARDLTGRVTNTSAGVQIDVEGEAGALDDFLGALRREAPPMSSISSIELSPERPAGYSTFEIGRSTSTAGDWQPVCPDSCTCPDCLAELLDPDDRRFRYPFINCTNCGPRFTIIEGLPYDRPLTTMRRFEMCPACREEYTDPSDRRFHAEPNACPECGPQLWLTGSDGVSLETGDPAAAASRALRDGAIVAVKGLGGFQLACLAVDEGSVQRLRKRKSRPDKPFAVMMSSADDAALYCRLSAPERQLLESAERPIVLLERLGGRGPDELAPGVAPRLGQLGVMLPATPLHSLLMEEVGLPLVMTSGNISEEPICRTNSEALSRLEGIADYFLLHDRGIRSTYDDSVVMVSGGETVMVRRARGYAPLPVPLPAAASQAVLACGGGLKNTFCLTRGDQAIVSQHLGDLENAETLLHYEATIALYEKLFAVSPRVIACDSHPDYLSTAYAFERDGEPVRVQHHQAHVASCLAENGHEGTVVGVALDGTGYGGDGKFWGGEFFTGSLGAGFDRAAHLDYLPLPGGDAAVREPWRTALGAVWRFAPENFDFVADRLRVDPARKELMLKQLWAGLNCPQTSSAGRLFDAVASLVAGSTCVSYEAQAAMELEALAERAAGGEAPAYDFAIDESAVPWTVSPAPVLEAILRDLEGGRDPAAIALGFHRAFAEVIVQLSQKLARLHGLESVALSGGVFQNRLLLRLVRAGFEGSPVRVLYHRLIPPGDGGISYGQAAMAIQRLRSG